MDNKIDQMLQLLNQLVAASQMHYPAAVAPPTQQALATPTRDSTSLAPALSSAPRRSHEEEV